MLAMFVRPASFASLAISAGVMSAPPTIFSCLRLSATVARPLKPMTIATTPNAIRLERFVTYGMTEEVEKQIGDPPHGRGILGVLIRDARNLRLHDLSEHPRSVGFPPGHPSMHTFLGVPILLRGVAYENL